jgi:hypothetical protein
VSDGDRLSFDNLRRRWLQNARLSNNGLNDSRLKNGFCYLDSYHIRGDRLFHDETGVRCPFGGGDPHARNTRGAIPLNAPYLGAAINIRINHRGVRAIGERSSRIGVRQPESNRRSGGGLGCAIGDFHGELIRRAFNHPQLKRSFRVGGRRRKLGANRQNGDQWDQDKRKKRRKRFHAASCAAAAVD